MLAIFLRTGVSGKSAIDLARELLTHCGSLSALCAASACELCELPGMGEAKYAQLQAMMELARRALKEKISTGNALNSPAAVRELADLIDRTLQSAGYPTFIN